ncbi:MAG TPA: HAD-IA family hydrolase [Candidatus Saccharimonadales bacterium]|nr:HAD-IA family hydrolase [Candidatus Saccharimonadales bacterium]
MDEQGLGRRLQEARLQSGLTQQALCQKAGLSYSTLTKIERGAIKAPSIFTIHNIAIALGMGLDELMGLSPARQFRQAMRSKSGVSFVFFDINGCLVRFYHRAFTRLAEVSGAPADVIETTFWHFNDDVCRGDMSMDEFNKVFAQRIGVPEVDWLEYYLDAIEPIAPMQDMLRKVSERYRVGLLTNIMPGFVDVMKQRGLLPNIPYDVIIDSSQVKAIKPERRIYEIATQKAGVPPSEILLVDDARANLMAAEKHDWHVLWFDDYRPEESISRIADALEPAA